MGTLRVPFSRFYGPATTEIFKTGTLVPVFKVQWSKCVQINIPSKTQKLNHGILIWVESAPDCSLESYIEKGLALHMTLLGFTISRDINPTIERLYFDDCSRFMCDLPTGESEPVSMKSFHIAFHGATWYEYYFDAQLVNNYDVYSKLKENLYK